LLCTLFAQNKWGIPEPPDDYEQLHSEPEGGDYLLDIDLVVVPGGLMLPQFLAN
jgi:hypothetical protein